MSIRGWALDYGWGHRDWDEDSDVALRGEISGPGQAQALAAVTRWLEGRHRASFLLDGTPLPGFHEGGGSFYLRDGAIFVHSSGQDAFDTIHWYSGEIAQAICDSGADVALRWHKLAHGRTSRS